jgi:WD40 repeat protein
MFKRTLIVVWLVGLAFALRVSAQTSRPVITPQNVGQIKQLARLPDLTRLNGLEFAWSPDGSRLAVAGEYGVQMYNFTPAGIQRGLFLDAPDSVRTTAFTSDGKLIAGSAGVSGAIWMWNAQTGDLAATLDGKTVEVEHIAFSPDGRYFASSAFEGSVKIWGVPTKSGGWQPFAPTNAYKVQARATFDTKAYILNIAFSPDSKTLLVLTNGKPGAVTAWDIASGKGTWLFPTHRGWIGLAVASDSSLIAYGGFDVRLWDASVQIERKVFGRGSAQLVNALSFSPDHRLLAAGYNDGWVRVWEVERGTELIAFAHSDIVWGVAFNPDGTMLAVRAWNDGVHIYGLGEPIPILSKPTAMPAPPATATLQPALVVGQPAVIHTTKGDTLNVRSNPGRKASLVAKLPNGTQVMIIDGPQEADGFTWWEIRTSDGIEGWAVEHAEDEQTLFPAR